MPHPPTLLSHPPSFRRRRRTRRTRGELTAVESPVLIRRASAHDEVPLARLAELEDGDPLPAGERLVGELDGRIVAALDVRSGAVVADPFVPTSGVVELLGLRAEQVRQ